MGKKSKEIDRSRLLELGLKDALLGKLSDRQIEDLLDFSLENSKDKDLPKILLQLASMEASNKKGAAYLALNDVATVAQLKNLTADQVEIVTADLKFHQDAKMAVKAVKKFVVLNQQEKMYFESGGLRGEYYVDPHAEFEDEEETA